MDRVFQWVWDRYAARYSWALCALMVPLPLPIFLVWSFTIVAFERSSHHSEAVVFTLVAVVVRAYMLVLPGLKGLRPVEQWASGHPVLRATRLTGWRHWTRRTPMPGAWLPGASGPMRFGPLYSWLLSVRSPGRAGGGWCSTGSWGPRPELPPC
jgi:hypothetical protein